MPETQPNHASVTEKDIAGKNLALLKQENDLPLHTLTRFRIGIQSRTKLIMPDGQIFYIPCCSYDIGIYVNVGVCTPHYPVRRLYMSVLLRMLPLERDQSDFETVRARMEESLAHFVI